jgi:hypothetical protein
MMGKGSPKQQELAVDYQREISEYLLGKLSKNKTTKSLRQSQAYIYSDCPIFDWWIFEGKSYAGWPLPLSHSWDHVIRLSEQMLRVLSPRWLATDAPEGEVDWVRTANRQATRCTPAFVCRTSAMGLSEQEKAVVRIWQSWIAHRWYNYTKAFGIPTGARAKLPWPCDPAWSWQEQGLRRAAQTARRSRWPLLRNLIAESLRSMIEPDHISKLVLPQEHSQLFEIVCLVRTLRAMYPEDSMVRWLNRYETQTADQVGNRIVFPQLQVTYQKWFAKKDIFQDGNLSAQLFDGVKRHEVELPRQADIVVQFAQQNREFNGILMEVKSGQQSYKDCVFQLQSYAQALPRNRHGKWLIWGIVEFAQPVTEHQLESLSKEIRCFPDRDLWVFSAASDIQRILHHLALDNLR